MVSKKVTVTNEQGLHMRPANKFVNEMSSFKSSITLVKDNTYIDAKSIMHLISACIKCGNSIELICEGEDENEALEKAAFLIQGGLGE